MQFDELIIDQVAEDTGKSKEEVRDLLSKGDKDIVQLASNIQSKSAEEPEVTEPSPTSLANLQNKAQDQIAPGANVDKLPEGAFRPTPTGTTPFAPTKTGRLENISSQVKSLQSTLNSNTSTENKSNAADKAAGPVLSQTTKDSSPESKSIAKRIAELQEEKQTALAEYKENKNRVANAELIDSIGKGLAQLVAGWYGLETGRDAVSGVDFKPKDWTNNYLLAEREYKNKLDALRPEETEIREEKKELAREARTEEAYGRRVTEAEKREKQALEKEERRESSRMEQARQKVVTDLSESLAVLKQSKSSKDRKEAEQDVAKSLAAAGIPQKNIDKALEGYKSPMFGYDYSSLESIVEEMQKQAPTQPAKQQPGTEAPAQKIRVKRKSDGMTGTINATDFDETKYDRA